MEFYGLIFSEYTRFDVTEVEDYNVRGSFNPNAVSDIEFYGYRETTFKVSSAQTKNSRCEWTPVDDNEVRYFAEKNDNALTLIVQDAIDKQTGEYNV